jgi:hypothetical protein
MSDEENGHGNVFLDRPEEFKEFLRQEHIAFAEEHKKLLAAQAILSHQLQEMRALQEATTFATPNQVPVSPNHNGTQMSA